MKHTQVFINSKNRTSGSSSSDFKVHLNRRIQNIHSVSVRSIEIPFSWYCINTSNNRISWSSSGTDYSATLSPGNYTADELAIELQNKMNAQLAGFIVTYEDKTLKYTFSHNSTSFVINYAESTCNLLIGLIIVAPDSAGLSWTSQNVIQITGSNLLFLESNVLSSGRALSHSDEEERPIFLKVPVNQNAGSIVTRESKDDDVLIFNSQFGISEIDFRLVDDEYNLVDLNGLDWSLELLVSSEQD